MLTASAFAGGPLESNSLIFVSCQLFTSVFGVGPKTAEKWYRAGLRSLDQILADQNIHLNHMQQNGASVSINTPTHTHTHPHTHNHTHTELHRAVWSGRFERREKESCSPAIQYEATAHKMLPRQLQYYWTLHALL